MSSNIIQDSFIFGALLQTSLCAGDSIKHNLNVFNQFDKDNINF